MSEIVSDILAKFSRCSLVEQLYLLRLLPSLMSVDFISLLPSLVVVRILGFLPVKETVSCLRVSRSWYEVISRCDEYWLNVCSWVGLSNELVRDHLPKYAGSTKSLALSAWGRCQRIKRACSDYKLNVMSKADYQSYAGTRDEVVWNEETGWSNFFNDGIEHLRGQSARGKRVIWAHNCDTKTVFANSDATWGVLYNDGSAQFWNDSSLVELAWDQIGEACNKCGLMARVKHCWERYQCKVRLVYLHPGCSTSNIQEYKCILAEEFISNEDCFLQLEAATLISSSDCNAQSDSILCYQHYLVIQVGGSILVFVHRHDTQRKLELLQSYSPSNCPDALTSAMFLGNGFCLSEDQCVVALMSSNWLYVWDLEKRCTLCEAMICSAGPSTYAWRCAAVGHLYAVVFNEFSLECVIVCVLNGKVLHKFKFRRHRPTTVSSLSLIEQGWLNSIDLPVASALNFVYVSIFLS